MVSKKTIKAFSHGKRAKHCYVCEDCFSNHSDKVFMCRVCRKMNITHFASKAEAKRGIELLQLKRAGQIRDLEMQKRFPLKTQVGDAFPKVGDIVLDFSYFDVFRNKHVLEDVKGRGCPLTELSDWKIKHFEAQYQRKVEIVRR